MYVSDWVSLFVGNPRLLALMALVFLANVGFLVMLYAFLRSERR